MDLVALELKLCRRDRQKVRTRASASNSLSVLTCVNSGGVLDVSEGIDKFCIESAYPIMVEELKRHPRYGEKVEQRTNKNMVDTLSMILRKEGCASLYKGILPSIVKVAPAAAVTFVSY